MNQLNHKITTTMPDLVVRKDLVKTVKGNAIVPSYVLEHLLGQYCTTSDEDAIQTGIETVKEILRKHFVHRNEADLIKSRIREKGLLKVIDKVTVALNHKRDVYEASFSNLGIKNVLIDSDTVKNNPKLLVDGVWCLADIEYQYDEDQQRKPWLLEKLKPIQKSRFDFERYLEMRNQFTTEEWVDLLLQTIGMNPEMFGWRNKLIQLTRLIPFCERNYNLIELGPKGTGKSHIYSEFSPHGMLISGGEVTVPKLFVNNRTGKIGLVGYWDTVAFDEFTGKKRKNTALVDILKNYMANKSFSRGIETLGAEASIVLVGNTVSNLPYMLKHTNLFSAIPEQYYDSAFLDRLHFYIPGWEVEVIRSEMFSEGYGFVVDYLAEILRHLRDFDQTQAYKEHFELLSELSTRDQTGIGKTFSGLMKIIFPSGEASKEDQEQLLRFAIEGRKRIKDQLMRIDTTYPSVRFGYTARDEGDVRFVRTLEEKSYPRHYYREDKDNPDREKTEEYARETAIQEIKASKETKPKAEEKHLVFEENQRGISFETLFGPYLDDVSEVTVQDPYIRAFYQVRNMMELIETIMAHKDPADPVDVHLITSLDDNYTVSRQEEYLEKIKSACLTAGVNFTWEFKNPSEIHARHIITDQAWKITLDRGLDIFNRYDMNDSFELSNRVQEQREVKAFEVTYLRMDAE